MSKLTIKATELIGVLHGILKCLQIHESTLSSKYCERLYPMVDEFEYAVFVDCSASNAKEALIPIKELMQSINGAATKGEQDFFPLGSDLLNHYWAIESIFRESRYSKMDLFYNWQADRP